MLVVGASSGIGRAAATSAVKRGARVVFAARRVDALREAVEVAGADAVAIGADVSRPEECQRLVSETAGHFGGIDLMLYATGVAPLRRMLDTEPDDWRQVFETNVMGACNVIRAALPLLQPSAMVGVLSSDSVPAPRPGLVAYAASKSALETMVLGWRAEHPRIRFGIYTVGPTVPTDFGRTFDMTLLGEMFADWMRLGMMQEGHMDAVEVGEVLADMLAAAWPHPSVGLEHLVLRPPFPIVTSLVAAQSAAAQNNIG
ncbi:MAG TPA: SDR family oxidoreductase [Acidimicrobiales bacterium]|jgi:NAD(P)-dependent dehydrogenase (short-subunit alcohol dehydrogenase family)|nr:SDR family oxidoreductase [Acidimicrobiales bacterium]